MPRPAETISAESFVATLAANVDNDKLTDAEFRQVCRNTLPIVQGGGRILIGQIYLRPEQREEYQGPYGFGNQDR